MGRSPGSSAEPEPILDPYPRSKKDSQLRTAHSRTWLALSSPGHLQKGADTECLLLLSQPKIWNFNFKHRKSASWLLSPTPQLRNKEDESQSDPVACPGVQGQLRMLLYGLRLGHCLLPCGAGVLPTSVDLPQATHLAGTELRQTHCPCGHPEVRHTQAPVTTSSKGTVARDLVRTPRTLHP